MNSIYHKARREAFSYLKLMIDLEKVYKINDQKTIYELSQPKLIMPKPSGKLIRA